MAVARERSGREYDYSALGELATGKRLHGHDKRSAARQRGQAAANDVRSELVWEARRLCTRSSVLGRGCFAKLDGPIELAWRQTQAHETRLRFYEGSTASQKPFASVTVPELQLLP